MEAEAALPKCTSLYGKKQSRRKTHIYDHRWRDKEMSSTFRFSVVLKGYEEHLLCALADRHIFLVSRIIVELY